MTIRQQLIDLLKCLRDARAENERALCAMKVWQANIDASKAEVERCATLAQKITERATLILAERGELLRLYKPEVDEIEEELATVYQIRERPCMSPEFEGLADALNSGKSIRDAIETRNFELAKSIAETSHQLTGIFLARINEQMADTSGEAANTIPITGAI